MKILFTLLISIVTLFGFEKLDSSNFDEKIKNKNVIVDFYAVWCPPCKILNQNLKDFDELKTQQDVTIFKVDVDEQMALARKYKITKLPSVVFIKNGKVKDLQFGVLSADELETLSQKHFK